MTDAQVKNVAWYVVIAIAGAVMAAGLQLGVMLSGPGDILIRPLLATFVTTLFGTLATAAGTSFRPRVDRSDLNKLVSTVGPMQAKAALEVEAARQVAVAPVVALDDVLDPSETDQLLKLVRSVGPQRSIRALNDEQYRDPSREDAP